MHETRPRSISQNTSETSQSTCCVRFGLNARRRHPDSSLPCMAGRLMNCRFVPAALRCIELPVRLYFNEQQRHKNRKRALPPITSGLNRRQRRPVRSQTVIGHHFFSLCTCLHSARPQSSSTNKAQMSNFIETHLSRSLLQVCCEPRRCRQQA